MMLGEGFAYDRIDTSSHILGSTPRECQQQYSLRADPGNNQVGNPVRKRHCLPGPGARDHQKRSCPK